MKDLQENIVPAEKQNSGSYFQYGGNGIKILFVGNSITKHGRKPSIGWDRDCGMAASSTENDYVHLVVKMAEQYDPDLSYSIAQVAEFERNFETMDVKLAYQAAIDYEADVIIMFFGANVDKAYDVDENPPVRFGDAYKTLRNALNSHGAAKVFHSQGFYIREKLNAEKKAVSEQCGDTYIELGEIVTRKETHGMFNHPNDLGMREIAGVFFQAIEPTLKELVEKRRNK